MDAAGVWYMTVEQPYLTSTLTDRYTLERELGSGGMSVVYLAHDGRLGRTVALKVLRPELAASLAADRFLREIEIAAQLSHPNILPLFDGGRIAASATSGASSGCADLLYYTMPFVEGESLRSRLGRERQLSIADAVKIAREVAEALAYAHGKGIVHRDIKPENILFQGCHALVADFGIARAVSAAGVASLTQAGLAVGTPAYMSPEQASGDENVGPASDVYSLGCVLYEMLVGDTPFLGSTPESILARKLTGSPPGLREVRSEISPDLERLVLRALARLAADRIPSASHLLEALGEAGRWREPIPRSAGPIDSIAVLPFEDLSQGRDLGYFADGMTEELISELGRIRAVGKVISRSSVMAYRDRRPPMPEIARTLGVSGIVEASVRHAADRVRITVRLVDAANDTQRWSRSFQRELTDILSLYEDVARAIADEIEVELAPAERQPGARPRRVNPQAYDAYLKGSSFLYQSTPQSFPKAIECFLETTALDAGFAPAYSGLGNTYNTLGELYALPSAEAFSKGRLGAEKALRLDPALPEAHLVLAWAIDRLAWDWATAEHEYRRAIELNEGYEMAHRWYGLSLVYRGHEERGIREMERAVELDPLAPMAHIAYGIGLYCGRRYAAAVAEFEKLIELDPTHPLPHWFLTLPYLEQERAPEAVASCHKAITLGGPQPLFLAFLGFAYGRAGQCEEARRILDELTGRASREYVAPDIFAKILTGMGEDDAAMGWLERAWRERAYGVIHLRSFPMYDSLRGQPRFDRIVEAVTPSP